ncbi:TonB-dependent receptor-like protein [Neolewinella xylanilytica]|uniref:TonB-dependent receptor-like protein n=1 Tax=Neolewinella xylanilytica TaxID=1514080 RepID=A0A2S6I388_9BACT|nr:TonB-dependent receptor [Neolewinella xylanilytica]PPK85620.1 TonB-dependent receptor-like protein [Neolewinella xylanilytica]
MHQPYLLLLFLLPFGLNAQRITGTLVDAQSEMPLTGATVELVLTGHSRGTTTDLDGRFTIPDVPPGRQTLRISYLGYQSQTIPNILITAGKDVSLDVTLEESVTNLQAVTVSAGQSRGAVNEMSTISTQQFTAEQVNRFAGGRADVSRLAGNLAGVATADDSRNDIVIRGNSPAGLLWQLEGIPIPNPNHFATLGTTGGPVSALNPNLLASSDFSTSAFAAEYGNALSGVFDLRLRRGNRDRYEFMGQLGTFSGLEAMAEGPIPGGGSFVASLRNSFVGLTETLGIDIGTNATPDYRDFTFNLDFGNGQAGSFSLFGIAGTSNIDFLAAKVDSTDLFANPGRNSYARSYFGVVGLRHNLITGENTYLRTVISGNLQGNTFREFAVDEELADDLIYSDVADRTTGINAKSYLNSKLSTRTTLRAGVQADLKQLRTLVDDRDGQPDRDEDGLPDLDRLRDFDGTFGILQAFGQARYRAGTRWTLNAGLHLQYFTLSEAFAGEPRLAAAYEANPALTFTAGYGRHSQVPALPVFFFRDLTTGRSDTNQDLGYLRADHYVVGAALNLGPAWKVKTEVYYQYLFEIPVDGFPSSFSILNAGADFVFPERGSLVNEGTGKNYGVELTIDRTFRDNWYLLLTGSVFESRYTGSDGIERNTAFNNEYVGNLLAGKEWPFGKGGRHRFTLNTKLTGSGGRYFSPVDLEASREAGVDLRDEALAFTERYAGYFRWDLKFGIQFNSSSKKFSQSFFIDLQNLTNRENIFQDRYNPVTGNVNTVYQSGFFPDVQYRVQF